RARCRSKTALRDLSTGRFSARQTDPPLGRASRFQNHERSFDRTGDLAAGPGMEGDTLVRSGSVGHSSDVNLWRIPLKFSLASVALFGITIIPDVLDALAIIHLPEWFTMGGIDDARAILSAMLGSVSTVLALIFSVALLVLSMVATLFGPRLLYRFPQD